MVQIFIRNLALPNKRIYDNIYTVRYGSSPGTNVARPYSFRGLIPSPVNGVYTFFGRPVGDSDDDDCVDVSTYNSLMSASNSQNDEYLRTLQANEELRRQVSSATAALLTVDELHFQLAKYKQEAETAQSLLTAAEAAVRQLETALDTANNEVARLKGEKDELLLELRSMPDDNGTHHSRGHIPVPFQLSDGAPPLPVPRTRRVHRSPTPSRTPAQTPSTPMPSRTPAGRPPAVRSAAHSPSPRSPGATRSTPFSSPLRNVASVADRAPGWEWHASQMSQDTIEAVMMPLELSPSPSPPPFDPARYIAAAKDILEQWGRLDQVAGIARVANLPRSGWRQALADLNLDPTLSQLIFAKWDGIATRP
jgi:hypothetical protein